MRKKFAVFYILTGIVMSGWLMSGCENEKDTYYDRPEWLEPPVYQQLEKMGNFTLFLKCIDISGNKSVLSGAGYHTIFAPTDSAFKVFLSEQNIQSIDQLDLNTAKKIVAYAMVQSRYSIDELDDYQSVDQEVEQNALQDIAFKRKTSYYKWTYEEDIPVYGMNKVIDANGVGPKEYTGASISYSDNNFKDIPYFTSAFMDNTGLSASDYNFFYPDVTLGDVNVVDARVLQKDIYAENGIIHVVDKVILPLPNIEEVLAEKDQFSTFRSLINEYLRRYQLADRYFLLLNEEVTGSYEDVFIKWYPLMYFSPNCENYLRHGGGEEFDDQIGGFTMIAPTNDALDKFFNEKFLKYYDSIQMVTDEQIADLINAHLWKDCVWPSKFNNTQYTNIHGEGARFDINSNIIDKEMCSNGLFYGTNVVQGSDLYYTVYGDAALNPEYITMFKAINTFPTIQTLLKNNNPDLNVQLILVNNHQFEDIGITYNYGRDDWEITDNNPLGDNVMVALERFLNLHIFINKDVDFEVPGIYKSGIYENGEYVKVAAYRRRYYVTSSGNANPFGGSQYLGPIEDVATNGQSYTLAEPILFSTDNVGVQIERNRANFQMFMTYLEKSVNSTSPVDPESNMDGYIYSIITKAITDVKISENNTICIPNDAAMQQAVDDGYLPEITIADFNDNDQLLVNNFVRYHILAKQILAPSIDYNNAISTNYKTVDGETYVVVKCENDVMEITDSELRKAYVVNNKSNILSNRAIIHQIDNYLRYPREN